MNTTQRNFCTALSLWAAVSVPNVSHAAIMQYEVTGTMWFVNPDWSSFTITPLSGNIYVSDINYYPTVPYGNVRFDIVDFVLHSDGFEQVIFNESGTGQIYGGSDRNIVLNSDDWQYRSGIVGAGWMELPETISWYGQGWIYGPEYYYKVQTFSVQAIGVVPIPATAWLFGSGLLGLVGIAKRKLVA